MQVVRADVLGMCFGVRDALTFLENVDQPEKVTVYGELVHNEKVLVQLRSRGFPMVGEENRADLPETEQVMITAHGISEKERRRLLESGKELLDTTCPLVKRAHDAAQKLQAEGFHVLVIGKPGHVEIEGITGDLESFDVVSSPGEVKHYPQTKLGMMCQTTAPERLVQQIRTEVAYKNPQAEIHFIDTVCHPTKDHQKALEKLLEEVDSMVVVGGKNSNNTKQLVNRCRERGLPAYHIQSAGDLCPEWFYGVNVVGLTAGTSTLDATIDEVYQCLLEIGNKVDMVEKQLV